MRKLVSVQQIIDGAKENGLDPESLVVDVDDVAQIYEDTIDNLTQNPEENPQDPEEED
jgi:hypothetical protein